MTGVDVAFSATSLLGPWGGMIGLAFAAGATAGWTFAQRTVLRLTHKRFDDLEACAARDQAECDRRISALEATVRELHERERSGMERQMAQMRESAVRVLWHGPEGDREGHLP